MTEAMGEEMVRKMRLLSSTAADWRYDLWVTAEVLTSWITV
jgi:hypothetical protein